MSRSLIIGASGQVGGHLANELTELNREFTVSHYHSSIENSILLDICNKENVFRWIETINPSIIYFPAAIANVDYCEQNPDKSYKINVQGVENIVEAAIYFESQLVFFSTDYIFDGRNGPYSEEDTPAPLCMYGRQKLIAENIIAMRLTNYIIIRTTIVYGWERQGKNFVLRLIRTLQNNQEIKVPTDQIGTPTYAPYLAKTSVQLAESKVKGIYNIAGKDLVNRYDFACEVAKIFKCDKSLIIPVKTNDLHQPAVRPLNAGLKINKVLQILNTLPLEFDRYLELMAKAMQ